MSRFDLLSFSIRFGNPWLLFLIVPAAALMLIPYFRLPKQHRRTRNRVISLVLHSLILTLCVLVLSGMNFEVAEVARKSDVILLADLSDSNHGSVDEMNEFIRTLVEKKEDDYRIGIVAFANGSVFSAEMRSDTGALYEEYLNNPAKPLGNATDIADALLYARDSLADPQNGRIILLSDGVETDGNALAAVKAVADAGVRVDTVYFSPKGLSREAQITAVEVPDRVAVGETVRITVVTDSASAERGRLILFDNGVETAGRDVQLSGGEDAFALDYTVNEAGLHAFRVTLESDGDGLSQNNEYYAYIHIEKATRILIVDGRDTDSSALEAKLKEDYEVTRTGVIGLPATLEGLCYYDELIFCNVANADLPADYGMILTNYVDYFGGGLFTLGGGNAYQEEDMRGSQYEALLPVESYTGARSLGLLIIIDRSSSMDAQASGGFTRLELAKNAAVESVNRLSPEDYAGVITFNSEATVVSDMLSVGQKKDAIIENIRGIKREQMGTSYFSAINTAQTVLNTFDATELKHIIFLTDGETTDSNDRIATCMERISQLARGGVTLSTIALSPQTEQVITRLQTMAKLGGGRFHDAARTEDLIEIMKDETETAAGEYSNEYTVMPSIAHITPAVAGLDAVPALNGFYGTRLKEGATMVLSNGANPIYAEWSRGEGRVGSFMSDLNGPWAENYLTDPAGIAFLKNAVLSLFPETRNHLFDALSAEFIADNFTTQIRIRTGGGSGRVTAKAISPSGAESYLTLTAASDSLYVGELPTEQAGLYKVEIAQETAYGKETLTAYTAFSYSREYEAFPEEASCFEFMERVSRYGNGSMLFSADSVFGEQNETTQATVDPRLGMLIACAVLFLLDVVVRKFKIKWFSEIAEERRKKREETAKGDSMRKFKIIFTVLLSVLLSAALLCACGEDRDDPPAPAQKFVLTQTETTLTAEGDPFALTLLVENVNDDLVWACDRPEVVSLQRGASPNKVILNGLAEGVAVVSVTAGDLIAVCKVTVLPAPYLRLLTEELTLFVDTTDTIRYETNLNAPLTFTSDDTEVATVNGEGLVSALKEGTAHITVSGGNVRKTCAVHVVAPFVSIEEETVLLTAKGETTEYLLNFVSNGEVEWSSSAPQVATVQNGLVTAVSEGEAVITARYGSAEDVCTVKVKDEILKLTLSETEKTLESGGSFRLTATLEPAQTGDGGAVAWSVPEGADLVRVDGGLVTSLGGYGRAVVRAQSVKDPDAYADCTVSIPAPYEGWIAISDEASLRAALSSGNENKNMYLTADIDLGGGTLASTLTSYQGTFDGCGYTIGNFRCGVLFGNGAGTGLAAGGVVKRLVLDCTLSDLPSNKGIFGEQMGGSVQNCIVKAVFGSAMWQAVFARNLTKDASVENTLVLAENPSGTGFCFAGCTQMSGTWKNVYCLEQENVGTNGPEKKTMDELRVATLYGGWDADLWETGDGLPVLKKGKLG